MRQAQRLRQLAGRAQGQVPVQRVPARQRRLRAPLRRPGRRVQVHVQEGLQARREPHLPGRRRVPGPGFVLPAVQERAGRVQVLVHEGVPAGQEGPHQVQGGRGQAQPAVRAQERHQEDRAAQAQRHHGHREQDQELLRAGLRLQDWHDILVGCHDPEDLQVIKMLK